MRSIEKPLVTQALRWIAAVAILSALQLFPTTDCRAESSRPIGNITSDRLRAADKEPGEWLTAGRDWQQSYYSPLTQINRKNASRLGYAWSHDMRIDASVVSTPIVVDGWMFTSGPRGAVYALDARTGALRWVFKPEVDPNTVSCCVGVNRGVAIWEGAVYVAALDGKLYALQASTDAVQWSVDTIVDHARSYSSTGAPYIAGGVVVIGNSGAEYDTRGYVTAYDLKTGRLVWRFFIVPGDPGKAFEHPELEEAASTWDPQSRWDLGLGGNAWDGMAYDPVLNVLFVGTGNALPWDRTIRSPAGGDNLFVASVLAINAATGRSLWHYQMTFRDNWDYNAAQKPILAELKWQGRTRKVVMQAPKNGFFYVLDRETGELLSAKPFAYVNWASHVDMRTGRPVETGKADYSKGPKLVFPSSVGAHSWQPMAFNPLTRLVYIPVLEAGEVFGKVPHEFTYRPHAPNTGVLLRSLSEWKKRDCSEIPAAWPSADVLGAGEPDPSPRTFLRAWNPVEQKRCGRSKRPDRFIPIWHSVA